MEKRVQHEKIIDTETTSTILDEKEFTNEA